MKYRIENWTIKKLIDLYNNQKLNLNPPYQRNEIWTINAQRELIDSIKQGFPLPVFFLHLKNKTNKDYDMVDGQQRTRSILSYYKGDFADLNGTKFNDDDEEYLNYMIPVIVIESDEDPELMREFYVRVNKTGLKLNRPELYKAEFFNTNFLKIAEELAQLEDFKKLNIFTSRNEKRMIDREFVEELIAHILYGNTDKKKAVDKIYREDIDDKLYSELVNKFKSILSVINDLNKIYPLSESRWKQKNDFYTLFSFILNNLDKSDKFFTNMYRNLIKFNNEIVPSNEKCEPFQNYAFYCISQSNSKESRDKRIKIINDIFLNPTNKPNDIQKQILKSYDLNKDCLAKFDDFLTFDSNKLNTFEAEII